MFHTNPNVTSPFHYVSLKEDLWEELANVLEAVDPKRIAINVSTSFGRADDRSTKTCRLPMDW